MGTPPPPPRVLSPSPFPTRALIPVSILYGEGGGNKGREFSPSLLVCSPTHGCPFPPQLACTQDPGPGSPRGEAVPTRVSEGRLGQPGSPRGGWANPGQRGEAGPNRVTEGGGWANPGHRGEAGPTRVTEGRLGQPGSPRGGWANPSNRELKLFSTRD